MIFLDPFSPVRGLRAEQTMPVWTAGVSHLSLASVSGAAEQAELTWESGFYQILMFCFFEVMPPIHDPPGVQGASLYLVHPRVRARPTRPSSPRLQTKDWKALLRGRGMLGE